MSLEQEFAVVDAVVQSNARTLGVDAFTLSVVKMERQMRRLFTYLVYQYPAFNWRDIPELRETLEACRNAYFQGFIRGINALAHFSIEQAVGPNYGELRQKLIEIYSARNKVFHGQLSGRKLTREQLLVMVATIRQWCEFLATGAQREAGYDGFTLHSFRKSTADLAPNFQPQLMSIDDYKQFIEPHIAGQRRW